MITVVKPSKPFQYTGKNTPRRQLIAETYDTEIKALYASKGRNQRVITPPENWDGEAVLEFVRLVAAKVLPHKVKDTDDIFQHGCDRFVILSSSSFRECVIFF